MRSRIEPRKKIARSLRKHRLLILNYFKARKAISSGVVEGLNNKAKVIIEDRTDFVRSASSNSPFITHLESYPNPRLATNSYDKSNEEKYRMNDVTKIHRLLVYFSPFM
jgi:hypothetical protein